MRPVASPAAFKSEPKKRRPGGRRDDECEPGQDFEPCRRASIALLKSPASCVKNGLAGAELRCECPQGVDVDFTVECEGLGRVDSRHSPVHGFQLLTHNGPQPRPKNAGAATRSVF